MAIHIAWPIQAVPRWHAGLTKPSTWGTAAPDDLFAALNGSVVTVLERQWTIDIYSIAAHHGFRWVQFGVESGPAQLMGAVRINDDDGVQEVLAEIAEWLTDASPDDERDLSVA